MPLRPLHLHTSQRRAVLAISLLGTFAFLFSKTSRADKAEVTITTANQAMQGEVEARAKLGLAFVEHYVGKRESYSGVEIDEAIEAWRGSTAITKLSTDLVVEYLGAFFGTYLARKLDLEWAIYADKQGEDLCVAHRDLSVVSFPHSAIYKAAVQGKERALPLVEEALLKQVAEALQNNEVRPR